MKTAELSRRYGKLADFWENEFHLAIIVFVIVISFCPVLFTCSS